MRKRREWMSFPAPFIVYLEEKFWTQPRSVSHSRMAPVTASIWNSYSVRPLRKAAVLRMPQHQVGNA